MALHWPKESNLTYMVLHGLVQPYSLSHSLCASPITVLLIMLVLAQVCIWPLILWHEWPPFPFENNSALLASMATFPLVLFLIINLPFCLKFQCGHVNFEMHMSHPRRDHKQTFGYPGLELLWPFFLRFLQLNSKHWSSWPHLLLPHPFSPFLFPSLSPSSPFFSFDNDFCNLWQSPYLHLYPVLLLWAADLHVQVCLKMYLFLDQNVNATATETSLAFFKKITAYVK